MIKNLRQLGLFAILLSVILGGSIGSAKDTLHEEKIPNLKKYGNPEGAASTLKCIKAVTDLCREKSRSKSDCRILNSSYNYAETTTVPLRGVWQATTPDMITIEFASGLLIQDFYCD